MSEKDFGIRILLNGAFGQMGRVVSSLIESGYMDTVLAACVDVSLGSSANALGSGKTSDFGGGRNCASVSCNSALSGKAPDFSNGRKTCLTEVRADASVKPVESFNEAHSRIECGTADAAVESVEDDSDPARTFFCSRLEDVLVDFDVIIDFSHHSVTSELLKFAIERKKPLVIATTGQTEDEIALIHEASRKIPVFFASNYSIGVATLIRLAKIAASALPDADIEIVETHHNRKIDAPSGTALTLFDAVKSVRTGAVAKLGRSGHARRERDEVGIHSLRLANVVGIHEVFVTTAAEQLVLRHEAYSREVFARGALDAAMFLKDSEPGLYSMSDMLERPER